MIAIGASLGGSAALRELLLGLPGDFPLAIAVVLHRHRESESLLVPLLARQSPLPVVEAEDKLPAQPGTVYVCPPDYHLLVDRGCFVLSTDDPVHFARPSIDVLFESVAEWEHQRAVGVVLTGGGYDGARGAAAIRRHGGTVVVQDPATAEGPWMPASALAAVPDALVLPLDAMPETLVRLARQR